MLNRFGALLLLAALCTGRSEAQFTHADSLRGGLPLERTSYDVRFEHLDVRIDPADSSVRGSNTITFTAVAPSARLQVDLFAGMNVDKVTLDGGRTPLPVQRDGDAMFITLPKPLAPGTDHALRIEYGGRPQVAKNPPWDGGFSWKTMPDGKPWVVVTCQGTGASLWWPNKDHQSDEPDSMLISITVPPGLEDVSNGRLRAKTVLADGWTRFDWAVRSPINNYNVTVNIGNYAHFSDVYKGRETVTLDYYVVPQNLEKAKAQFAEVNGMMKAFEEAFGPYPFREDGYKLIECPHNGMEHQSAVAYGNQYLFGYKGRASSPVGLKFDFIIVHESAHEWWGNSVTSKDIADMWIHESFGAYSEAVYVESLWGKDEAMAYVNGKKGNVRNDRPIIGTYGVQNEGSGDMYDKGQLVLNTLRHVFNDDSLWFGALRTIQKQFYHRTVTADDIFGVFNAAAGRDLTPFYTQYLRGTDLPTLMVFVIKKGDDVTARYRWSTGVDGFTMPAVLHVGGGKDVRVNATTAWQTVPLPGVDPEQVRVDETQFYIRSNVVRTYLDPRLPR